MAGYELFYENGQLIHLTKDGQCALGSALAGAYYAYQAGGAPAPSTQCTQCNRKHGRAASVDSA
jgi:hypothetical protein